MMAVNQLFLDEVVNFMVNNGMGIHPDKLYAVIKDEEKLVYLGLQKGHEFTVH